MLASMDFAVSAVGMLGGVRFCIAAPETRVVRVTMRRREKVNFIVAMAGDMYEVIFG
jgi:hypothetical protein